MNESLPFLEDGEIGATLQRLVACLEKTQAKYAIVGGIAVCALGHQRSTGDVDVLLNAKGFDRFRQRCVPQQYDTVPGRSRRFLDRISRVRVDVVLRGGLQIDPLPMIRA